MLHVGPGPQQLQEPLVDLGGVAAGTAWAPPNALAAARSLPMPKDVPRRPFACCCPVLLLLVWRREGLAS